MLCSAEWNREWAHFGRIGSVLQFRQPCQCVCRICAFQSSSVFLILLSLLSLSRQIKGSASSESVFSLSLLLLIFMLHCVFIGTSLFVTQSVRTEVRSQKGGKEGQKPTVKREMKRQLRENGIEKLVAYSQNEYENTLSERRFSLQQFDENWSKNNQHENLCDTLLSQFSKLSAY